MLYGSANITTILKSSMLNSGNFNFTAGTVSLEATSGTQLIQVNSGDFFNALRINSGGTITLNNSTLVKGTLTIQSGVFNPQNFTVSVQGDWSNTVGADGFVEGSGRIIFNGGNYHQYCSNETFNILEVNKTLGGAFRVNGTTVTCAQYDWTAGSIDVLGNGTFTALDLADQGIRGNYYVNTGSTINLYQDALQYVDLGGNLTFTGGGTINVYGGSGTVSQWPTYANASITMNGGILDFKDQSITINTLSGYTLTTNITGGTIRTPGDFFCNRSDFNPSGGTLEMFGTNDKILQLVAGSLSSLNINKNAANTVTLNSNITLNGGLMVSSGTLSATNKVITIADNINIYWGGVLFLGANSQLQMANAKYLYVNNGGTLKTEGTGADNVNITHSAGYYFIVVQSNGTISAKNTYFQYLNTLSMQSGSILDPYNAFYRCTFTNNSAAYSAMLTIANSQEVIIKEAKFPVVNSAYSVSKPNNAGKITFKDATGAYAGPAYENDPYNRIDWVASTPGLWTGLASSDWFNSNNWDDNNLPTSTTNVTIPAGTLNSPIIGSGDAYCYDIVLEAGTLLTQNGGNFHVYHDFNSAFGQYVMTGNSYLYFRGTDDALWTEFSQWSNPDAYTNVRVEKSSIGVVVKTADYGHITNIQRVRIIEGTFELGLTWFFNVLDSGTEAFWVENGGKIVISHSINTLDVAGNVHLASGSVLENSAGITCGKDFIAEAGSVISGFNALGMDGSGTQYIDIQSGSEISFGGLGIYKSSGVCYIKSGDLSLGYMGLYIGGGTLSCDNGPSPTATYDIYVRGNWNNDAGLSGFQASSGKVIFTNGWSSYVKGETSFNVLEMNKGTDQFIIEGTVTCSAYDWTSGSVKVLNGATFTASDLLDNAIKGSFICEEGGTINLTNSGFGPYVDLAGELHNFGGTINISGSISYWPYGGNAAVEMTGGVIDLKTCGLTISNTPTYSLNENITGGTIRTAYGFSGTRADFTPAGGTFEFYGSNNAYLSQSNGCTLYNVTINKSSKEGGKDKTSQPIIDERSGEILSDGGKANLLELSSDFYLTNNLIIQSGLFSMDNYTLNIKGDWNNLVGPDGFIEGTGRVVFSGTQPQFCSTEEFNILEIDKPMQLFYNQSNASISCQVYDWTQGGIWIAGNGNFYAADLADNGIFGEWALFGNSIELHQDFNQSAGFQGNVIISSGVFDVYGGSSTTSHWGNYADVNFTMTGGLLDFHYARIDIHEYNPPHLLAINISGGHIRAARGFSITHPVFQPSGGMCEVYGYSFSGSQSLILQNGATLNDLLIDIYLNFVRVNGDIHLQNATITSGALVTEENQSLYINESMNITGVYSHYMNFNGNTVFCNNSNLIIENFASLENTGTIKFGDNSQINVNSEGRIIFKGNVSNFGKVTSVNPSDRYGLNVNEDGYFQAFYTRFENMNSNGITINSGAILSNDYDVLTFANCEFANGTNGAYPMLTINNEQDVVIDFVNFPQNTWGGLYNVAKTNNAGSVTFRGILGNFAGEAFENDPYNRIHWLDESNQLDVKVWLEGPFNGTDMNTGLTSLPDFPLSQPYNVSPWNYSGTETLTSIPADVVDWILVEWRDEITPYQANSSTRILRQAALLKKDGSIVGIDGNSPLQFQYTILDELFVVIQHRNHLGIISNLLCSQIENTYYYDFRTDIWKANGDYMGYKELGEGKAVMVAGDGNADGNITIPDKTVSWTPNSAKKGYLSGDYNLDTQVNNKDKNDYWFLNYQGGYSSQVPH
jgi:hypothetical protein